VAYDSFTRVNAIDINNPTSSIEDNSLAKQLSSAPNTTHENKGVNQDPSMNSPLAFEANITTHSKSQPEGLKPHHESPEKTLADMGIIGKGQAAYWQASFNINKSIHPNMV